MEVLNRLEGVKKELAETDETEHPEELKTRLKKWKAGLNDMAMILAKAGDACFELGELDKAIETIRKAISLDPENKQYRRQLKKFEQAKKVKR